MSEVEMVLPERPVFTPNADMYGMTVDIPRKGKLKPCPFCGSMPVVTSRELSPILRCFPEGYYPARYYAISCSNKDCGVGFSGFWSEAEAIKAWNRRKR